MVRKGLKKGGSNDRHSHVSKSSGSEVVCGDQRRGIFISAYRVLQAVPGLVFTFSKYGGKGKVEGVV
jgi:hypothetical protein